MYKVVEFVRFRPGVDAEKAREYWADIYGPLVNALPALERHVQNDVLASDGADPRGPREMAIDSYACLWFPDETAFAVAARSPEWASAAAARALIAGPASVIGPVAERVIVDGAAGRFKVCGLAHFSRSAPKEHSRAHWATTHAVMTQHVPGLARYVQNDALHDGESTLPVDGFSEQWFADRDGHADGLASPQWAAVAADDPTFLDTERLWGAAVAERVLKP